MGEGVTLEDVLARLNNVEESFELESILNKLPMKGPVSLASLCKTLKIDGLPSRCKKEDLVLRIVLHHWMFVVLPHVDRRMVGQQLQGLPVKGPVSLRSLLAEMNLRQAGDKTAMIQTLLCQEAATAEVHETVSVSRLKAGYSSTRGVELEKLLRSCELASLLEVCVEIGCGKTEEMKSWKKAKVVQQLVLYQPDFLRGLPWVERKLADNVAAVETFRSTHQGNLPKRVHRRSAGGLEEDRLAQKWRRVVHRKMNPNAKGGLTPVEIQYIEAVLGKDVWGVHPRHGNRCSLG